MTIPALNEEGLLPLGIHTAALSEIHGLFGQYDRE
jgi:hypothetical protein